MLALVLVLPALLLPWAFLPQQRLGRFEGSAAPLPHPPPCAPSGIFRFVPPAEGGPYWEVANWDYVLDAPGPCGPAGTTSCGPPCSGDNTCVDVFLPTGAIVQPTILWLHGGGFRTGMKEGFLTLRQQLVRMGYPVVSANYRLACAPEPPLPAPSGCSNLTCPGFWPKPIEDGLRLTAWLRDPQPTGLNACLGPELVVAGSSAGGLLACMLGGLWNEDPDEFFTQPPSWMMPGQGAYPELRPDLVVTFGAPTDPYDWGLNGYCVPPNCLSPGCLTFECDVPDTKGYPSGFCDPNYPGNPWLFMDLPPQTFPAEWVQGCDWFDPCNGPFTPPVSPATLKGHYQPNGFADMSPIYRIDALDPPMRLFHNPCDNRIPWAQGVRMRNRLVQNGVCTELVPLNVNPVTPCATTGPTLTCSHEIPDVLSVDNAVCWIDDTIQSWWPACSSR